MDLAHWIERQAAFAPDHIAIRFHGQDRSVAGQDRTIAGHDLTYAGLARRVEAAVVRLAALRVREGDVVAFLGYNSPDFLTLLFACARLRAIAMPLNWRLAAAEHARILELCPPALLVAERDFFSHARGLSDTCSARFQVLLCEVLAGETPTDQSRASSAARTAPAASAGDVPVLICHTSGATGAPKAVVLTQDALFWNAVNATHMHDLTSADRILTTLPMFHVGGINIQTLPALHAGASVTLHAKFDPAAAIDTIERERITLTVLVPAQLVAMMEHPRWADADLSSLRMITTGSTIVSESFVRRVHAKGPSVIQVYGSTETGPIAAYVRADAAERRAGAAGLPALHCELRVVDQNGTDVQRGRDGEILVRGPNVMQRYWNAPQATAAALRDGWYHTSDIGHFDEDGYLHVVARKSDMIISGGENIYPAEIETILAECPSIREACVIGQRDERWGEMVVAVIALQPDAALTEADVMALFADRIARYKHPRAVRFVQALPRNELGKIKRSALQGAADFAPA
jgi:fatty-acyl-CoA synthase